jgi:hypothetical protein
MRIAVLLASATIAGCGQESGSSSAPARNAGPASQASEWFSEQAEQTGLDFVHFNGMSGQFYYPEHMAPGVALFDYDNDGDLDVFIVQGQMLGAGKALSQARFPPTGPLPLKGRLFRNDLDVHADGTRTLRFTDVTASSGIEAAGYGMGVAAGDYNNDGCIDLYVTSLGGPNQMFRNNCDGTFTDVSSLTHTDDSGWSVSAAFVDYDRDGWLDLFVGHYLSYSLKSDVPCFSVAGRRDYCPPRLYTAQPSRLYHNNRDGTFSDVTAASGLASEFGPALGVATADFNGDGWIDIYVANDGQPNQLWINQRDGTFKNTGLISGTAFTADGHANAGMGVDAGDVDNDGDEDLFVTNFVNEGDSLFVNNGSGLFDDQSAHSGVRFPSLANTGFGTAWLDFDNDGWLDIMTVNGSVTTIEALAQAHDPFPLHERYQLFRNLGDRRFEEVTDRAGAAFRLSDVSRGAAFGDIDNDGDEDVVVGNDSGHVRLLINNVGNRANWLGLRLVSATAPRDMLGARVAIERGDGLTMWRRARADGSYASANDPRVLAGLGQTTKPPRVRVLWPDGRAEEWADVPINRYTTLKEGGGSVR